MKIDCRPILSILFLLLLVSCDNELDLVEDKVEIPVVYGLISPSDTAQYIRLERAFVDNNTSALILAQDPDSLYYPNASVALIRSSNGQRFELERVDGNDDGYPREDGVFAKSPNFLYKILSENMQISPGESYELEIVYDEATPPLTAQTVMLDTASLVLPNLERNLRLTGNSGFEVQIRQSNSAKVYDVFMIFHYLERVPGGNEVEKSFTTRLVRNFEDLRFEIPSDEIYLRIAQNIPFVDGAERRFAGIQMRVDAGGTELLEYLNIGQANLGITSSQAIPTYSNLSTGVGFLSSRSTYISSRIVNLNSPSADSLVNGSFTRNLNFSF